MRFVPLPLIACSLIAVIPTSQGYVSGVNPRLTTAEPTNTIHEVTISHNEKHQAPARDNDRVIFPSSWSQGDLGQNTDQRSRTSQAGQTDSVVAGGSQIRGSFTNSYPSTHSMQLKNSFPENRVSVHPFERDDDDDGPIWQD